jgi:hypothetical protein
MLKPDEFERDIILACKGNTEGDCLEQIKKIIKKHYCIDLNEFINKGKHTIYQRLCEILHKYVNKNVIFNMWKEMFDSYNKRNGNKYDIIWNPTTIDIDTLIERMIIEIMMIKVYDSDKNEYLIDLG